MGIPNKKEVIYFFADNTSTEFATRQHFFKEKELNSEKQWRVNNLIENRCNSALRREAEIGVVITRDKAIKNLGYLIRVYPLAQAQKELAKLVTPAQKSAQPVQQCRVSFNELVVQGLRPGKT